MAQPNTRGACHSLYLVVPGPNHDRMTLIRNRRGHALYWRSQPWITENWLSISEGGSIKLPLLLMTESLVWVCQWHALDRKETKKLKLRRRVNLHCGSQLTSVHKRWLRSTASAWETSGPGGMWRKGVSRRKSSKSQNILLGTRQISHSEPLVLGLTKIVSNEVKAIRTVSEGSLWVFQKWNNDVPETEQWQISFEQLRVMDS